MRCCPRKPSSTSPASGRSRCRPIRAAARRSFVFKQTGEKLAGKYKGQLGEADLTGTVTGKTLKFSFSVDAQGTALTITYEGEIESNTSVKGKVDLGGMASGTFTGKKK